MKTKSTNQTKSLLLTSLTPALATMLIFSGNEAVFAKLKTSNSLLSHHTETITSVAGDTVKGTSRRDEYFKDVQIVIEDKPAGFFINKPYKELTEVQKEHYLSSVPKKEKAEGLQVSDYNSYIKNEEGTFYLDNKKVTRDEIIKHPRENFACGGFKRSEKNKSYFFYTYPYFDKNIKSRNDHYSEKIYKITILNEVLEYQPEKPEYKRNGDTGEEYTAEVSSMSYGYTDEIKRTPEVMAHFPGGNEKFNEYFFSNLKVPENLKQNEIGVTFIINTNGSLSDIFPEPNTDPLIITEVTRVMLASPKWIPAQKNGQPSLIGTRLFFKK